VNLRGRPTEGTVFVAADDFAAVHVNGALVGTVGSVTSPSLPYPFNVLTSFDVTPFLVAGPNVLTIEAQNGPGSFAGCSPCAYGQNPAGVVFGWSLTYHPSF
jgi:hypothetical protein